MSVIMEKAVLEHIRMDLRLYVGGKAVIGLEKHARLIKCILDQEFVSKDEIAKAVHDRLCDIGREMYEWHICSPRIRHPDHCSSPEALGYVILHSLSQKEVGSIWFDHGETAEEFGRRGESLLEKVIEQLANGTAFIQTWRFSSMAGDDECLCSD